MLSRADLEYPKRLKARLKDISPPIIYGCGDEAILNTGGLAVVGSRHVDDAIVEYTQDVGRLAAKAGRSILSGAARGVDQAAMQGALEAGGSVVGVLADSLERFAMNRTHRSFLMESKLVLISPYDPSTGFNVGHTMQRNKLIYALADAALVANSDYQKGGTWAGAIEQLEKFHFVPVYVRSGIQMGRGLEGLNRKGALLWPDPSTPEEFIQALTAEGHLQEQLPLMTATKSASKPEKSAETVQAESPSSTPSVGPPLNPADELFATARSLIERIEEPKTELDVASELNVSRSQAKNWLQRLVKDGVLEKLSRPVRYRAVSSQYSQPTLIDDQ